MSQAQNVFTGGGEMARLMRSFDWSRTDLGPASRWPESLRSTIGICLASRFPIVLYWGREYTVLYNDAYSQILGAKHPQALGQPCSVCWAEIWDTIGPMLNGVVRTGQATWSDDKLLVLHRHGYPEECYFSFSFSPVRSGGEVAGVFTAVVETTGRVLGERRLDTLRHLAERTAARSVDEACTRAADALDSNPADIPFSLVYLLDGEGSHARLAASTGIRPGTGMSPSVVRLDDASSPWPMRAAVDAGQPQVVRDLGVRHQPLSERKLPPPDTALVLPLALAGLERPAGVLVAGVSPRQALRDDYRSFFDLVAGHVAAAIAYARAYSLERQRAETLAELDRAKTSFFSSVSHEFRTPLTLMLGPLEEALDTGGALPEAQRSLVETAHRNGLRLLRLVNTLLDFARLEAGRLEAVWEPVDLSRLTADLASAFRSAVEKVGLRLRVDCPALGEQVFVDPDMWEKIVLNILSNAFKFTFAGEIEVRLRRLSKEAVLTVSDTGVGIPESELPRIFERFHQVSAVRARTLEGSGIGLALVRDLVALHGGRVEVASQLGQGTCFTVRLPLGSAHLPPARIRQPRGPAAPAISAAPFVEEALRWLPGPVPSPADGEPPVLNTLTGGAGSVDPGRTQGARVLVADDNADMRAYLLRLLSRSWEVEVVNDGRAALASATANPPSLVLTDVMMPGLDGLELVKALRRDPRTAVVPVLVLSARSGQEATVDGLGSGADDYLVKPFTAAELLARVRANLELSHTRLEAQSAAAQLQAARRSQGHALEVLRAVSRLTDMGLDMTQFFLNLTETVARLVRARRVVFLTLEDDASLTARAGAYGFAPEAVAELRDIPCRANGDGILDRIVHAGRVYRSRIAPDDPELRPYLRWLDLVQVRDVLAIAWKAADRSIGIVAACDSTRQEGFTDEDAWVLRVAGKAAGTVWLHRVAEIALGEMRDAEADRLRAAARQAAELEKVKTEFLLLASHELRGPVTVLRGYLTMLCDGEIPGDPRPIYQILLSKVDEAHLLVERMLETARLEDRRLVLEVESLDVRDVARTAARAISLRRTDHHRLELNLPDEPVLVSCDRARLLTILANLLDNAIKYSPDGGAVRLSLRVDAGSRRAEISVSDDGIGIDAKEMPLLFNRFGRVVNADNSHLPGTGLGLYVARELARMHGGDIVISSRRHVGTTVVVTLPLADQLEALG
jgi:signal transduction histidine kinase